MARPNQTGPKQDEMEEYHWWSMYPLGTKGFREKMHIYTLCP